MEVLVRFQLADGRILGHWEAASRALLEAQRTESDVWGYAFVETATPMTLPDQYYVLGGALTAKTVLTLTADPNPFATQGQQVCIVSVTPFVPCTLLVDGVPYALVPEDQALEITSNVPRRFQVTLAEMTRYRAEPITVEAT